MGGKLAPSMTKGHSKRHLKPTVKEWPAPGKGFQSVPGQEPEQCLVFRLWMELSF